MSSRIRALTLATAASVIIASCGVPTGPDSFEAIDGGDVPNRLNETTTTTTTTTLPPPTTLADQPPTTTTTTSEPEIQTALVDVYFISGGKLRPIPLPAPIPPEAIDLIVLLENGPDRTLQPLLDNLINDGLIETTSEENGILTIGLNDRVFQRILRRNQREAVAQMVLTFLNNLTGVGQALFTIDDEPLTVPVGNSEFTDDPVSLDDYENMLLNADPLEEELPTTTTTSTTTSTTPAATTAPEPPSTEAPSTTTV